MIDSITSIRFHVTHRTFISYSIVFANFETILN